MMRYGTAVVHVHTRCCGILVPNTTLCTQDAIAAALSEFEEDLSGRLWFSYRTGFTPVGIHPTAHIESLLAVVSSEIR